MTHKQIVRTATTGNLTFLYVYRNLRLEHNATPPANARQVFASKSKPKFKTDKQRVRETQANDYRFKNPNNW
jgi:hypothetical protein